MQYQVLRAFDAGGKTLQPGEIVDVTGWRTRNIEGLVNDKRLKPLGPDAPDGFEYQLVRRGVGHNSRKGAAGGRE